jgi:5-bromo-4-chloroindolyl phosphate hydrolysis protein
LHKRAANFTQQSSEETKILLNQIEELLEKCENYKRATNKEIDVLKVGHGVEVLLIPKGDFVPTRICHSPYQLE